MQGTFERYFTRQEERSILGAAWQLRADLQARRDYWVMMAMRHSGGRGGSIVALNVCDAEEAIAERRLYFRTAKGGRSYDIPVNRLLRRALRELLLVRKAMGYSNADGDVPLLMSRNHKRLNIRSLQLRVKKWCTAAGIAHGTPHFFRHTLGRNLVARSTSPEPRLIVQRILGHSSINSTAIYTAPGREEIRQAMEGQA